METIRIVKGVYGYRKPGSKTTTPKYKDDLPFEVEDEEAARLVKLGVAVIAVVSKTTEKSTQDIGDEEDEDDEDIEDDEEDEDSDDEGGVDSVMTLAGLKRVSTAILERLAAKYGVDISKAANNKERAKLIYADAQKNDYVIYRSECKADTDDDGETPPSPGANEPVE